jgi:arabinosyltransferase C
MLTNSLFMVSLCLIIYIFTCFLDARASWKPVLGGVLAMGVLMNIHSYDVLLIALTMVGFLAMTLAQKQFTTQWLIRSLAVAAGVLPAALWFVYVLKHDPVFQARAATETFSPNFRQVLFGYLPMMALGFVGIGVRNQDGFLHRRRTVGLTLVGVLFGAMFVLAQSHADGYFFGPVTWAVTFVVAVVALALIADERPAWNLIVAWAIVGTVALYFPALFQRKLAMGLSVPWCILAALGMYRLLAKQERSARNLATILVLILLGATSLRWFVREIQLARTNVSSTTVHPVYLSPDAVRIRNYLNDQPGRKTLIAPPGLPAKFFSQEDGKQIPDEFGSPLMPDLNAILSGTTGVYTFAGHWSETPDYNRKVALLYKLYFNPLPPEEQQALVKQTGAEYIVIPMPQAFEGLQLSDLSGLGETVVDGSQFRLLKVPQP